MIPPRRFKGFTLVEIMIVVGILSIIIIIAVPAWLRQRQGSMQRACQENLTKIDGGKQVWALEKRKGPTDTPASADIFGETLYVRQTPLCPTGGSYSLNALSSPPSCTLSTLSEFEHTFPDGTN